MQYDDERGWPSRGDFLTLRADSLYIASRDQLLLLKGDSANKPIFQGSEVKLVMSASSSSPSSSSPTSSYDSSPIDPLLHRQLHRPHAHTDWYDLQLCKITLTFSSPRKSSSLWWPWCTSAQSWPSPGWGSAPTSWLDLSLEIPSTRPGT